MSQRQDQSPCHTLILADQGDGSLDPLPLRIKRTVPLVRINSFLIMLIASGNEYKYDNYYN